MPEPTAPRPLDPAELGFEKIVYEKAPPRATITLNRPEVLNAFDFQMLRELSRACEDASWDDEIRVVVVTGTGRAFCVGADLRSWGAELVGNPKEYWKWFGAFKDMHDRLREVGKPTLARVQGIAVGGGNELQMGCDLSVMVDDAFIRHVGPEHGSVPAGGATQWLPIFVGDRRAREILLMCEEIPARLRYVLKQGAGCTEFIAAAATSRACSSVSQGVAWPTAVWRPNNRNAVAMADCLIRADMTRVCHTSTVVSRPYRTWNPRRMSRTIAHTIDARTQPTPTIATNLGASGVARSGDELQ